MLGVVKLDPWLEPFQGALKRRFSKAQKWIETLDKTEGGLDNFSKVSINKKAGRPVLSPSSQHDRPRNFRADTGQIV